MICGETTVEGNKVINFIKVDKDGNATLYFNCPAQHEIFYQKIPKHIHYRIVMDDHTISEIKTINFEC